eukprot:74522_1
MQEYCESKQKYELFAIVKNIITKFNEPAQIHQQNKECGSDVNSKVFELKDCSYVTTIILALKQYTQNNDFHCKQIQIELGTLLGAYEHIVSMHNLHQRIKKNENTLNDDNSKNSENVKTHIIKQTGMCQVNECAALKYHITRRREITDAVIEEKNDNDNDLTEIMMSTISTLHTYIMHDSNELYRLRRLNGNSHFMSCINDDIKDGEKNEETKAAATISINFGV